MAQTKLQQQIEASARKIQEEQKRFKQLEKQQAERDRKDRNHRLCKRHGFIESLLPDIINLTQEQFEAFVKNHIANKHGIAAITDLMAKNATSNPTPAPNGTGQNHNNQQHKNTSQNATNPANKQGATA